jgi:hypothetical protein
VRVRCTVTGQEDCFVKLSLSDPALAGLSEGSSVVLHVAQDALLPLIAPPVYLVFELPFLFFSRT